MMSLTEIKLIEVLIMVEYGDILTSHEGVVSSLMKNILRDDLFHDQQ